MVIKRRFLTVLGLLLVVMLASGCDHGIRTVGIEFGQFPRIVYIAGVDTQLDFSDATLVTVHADGHRNEFPFPTRPCQLTTVKHNVDFTTPGVYRVEVWWRQEFIITFFVQVIDTGIFKELLGICEEKCDNLFIEEE